MQGDDIPYIGQILLAAEDGILLAVEDYVRDAIHMSCTGTTEMVDCNLIHASNLQTQTPGSVVVRTSVPHNMVKAICLYWHMLDQDAMELKNKLDHLIAMLKTELRPAETYKVVAKKAVDLCDGQYLVSIQATALAPIVMDGIF